ncbi:hypothetical protein F5884DRAFT_13315 [Xylogone sp. PMI_703]|nr:hypothetical protein F5884DRAFT_13315 [Xylogone sp. PMI_703]
MAESGQRHPHRASRWGTPAISVKVEVGLSLNKNDPPRTKSWQYASKKMQQRLQIPPPDYPWEMVESHVSDQSLLHLQARQRRHQNNDRGSSAPPSARGNQFHLHGLEAPRTISPTSQRPSLNDRYRDRPLPPTPPTFRLGDDLPWTSFSPVSVPDSDAEGEERTDHSSIRGTENDRWRDEDPQRIHDMEALHSAMMTVDSLQHEQWDPWTWESVGDFPRGPRSLGWAIRSDSPQVETPKPPPYCVSQYQAAIMRSIRRRSST